jgi:DNA-binding MarR family transcriptional regulator
VTAVEREANVLGALATIITDRTAAAVTEAAGGALSDAIALAALHHFLDRPTIDRVGRVLGLTPSGAVRVVDRLAAGGYVGRGAGADGRSRTVALTAKGQRVARRVAAARARVLNGALDGLTPTERQTLHDLLGRVLGTLVTDKIRRAPEAGGWTCRLCDTAACGRASGDCPAANAGRTAVGAASDSSAVGAASDSSAVGAASDSSAVGSR